MGYTTDFNGTFEIDKPLDDATFNLLKGIQKTRRVQRNVDAKFGVDGEFYIADDKEGIVDYNRQPETQPGLWCQWEIQKDRQTIKWDGDEKFYEYIPWIQYIISRILAPRGYVLNGSVNWRGEDFNDTGVINVVDNKVDGVELPTSDDVIRLLKSEEVAKEELRVAKKVAQKAEDVKIIIKDGILRRMMVSTNFKGTIDEYKEMLKTLVD